MTLRRVSVLLSLQTLAAALTLPPVTPSAPPSSSWAPVAALVASAFAAAPSPSTFSSPASTSSPSLALPLDLAHASQPRSASHPPSPARRPRSRDRCLRLASPSHARFVRLAAPPSVFRPGVSPLPRFCMACRAEHPAGAADHAACSPALVRRASTAPPLPFARVAMVCEAAAASDSCARLPPTGAVPGSPAVSSATASPATGPPDGLREAKEAPGLPVQATGAPAHDAARARMQTDDSDRDPEADAEGDSDAALSTSTVTSVDSGDVFARDESTAADSSPSLAFRVGIAFVPHPDKKAKGGEDAYVVQRRALGVFDGVGGWANVGVDAGLYSKELARLVDEFLRREGSACGVAALRFATETNRAVGSSTACVAGLDGTRLVGVNLGDSGLMVVRRGEVVFRTEEQQHYFNCPYQIGTDSFDTVDAGAKIEFELRHGDCIIVGTDGLWDNVFAKVIVDVVVSQLGGGRRRECASSSASQSQSASSPSSSSSSSGTTAAGGDAAGGGDECGSDSGSMLSEWGGDDVSAGTAGKIAAELADCATRAANDDRGLSPFAINAQKAGHMFLGGKVDDITIVVALVMDSGVVGAGNGGGTAEAEVSFVGDEAGARGMRPGRS